MTASLKDKLNLLNKKEKTLLNKYVDILLYDINITEKPNISNKKVNLLAKELKRDA
ncbi:MAG: hypothetical protein RJA25_1749, partial [Bacteroidota bacterium]